MPLMPLQDLESTNSLRISTPDYFRLRGTKPFPSTGETRCWREPLEATSRTSLEMYRENCLLLLEGSPSIKFSWFVGG